MSETRIFTLSSEITHQLLSKGLDVGLAKEIEEAARAYVNFGEGSVWKIISQPPGKGPARAAERFESSDPLVQAIGILGLQADSWQALYEALNEGKANLYYLYTVAVWYIYLTINGEGDINIREANGTALDLMASEVGDKEPRFDEYVQTVNYTGDANAYIRSEARLHRVRVRNPEDDYFFETDQLGISEKLSRATFESWRALKFRHRQIKERETKAIIGYTDEEYGVDIRNFNKQLPKVIAALQEMYGTQEINELTELARVHAENYRAVYEAAKERWADVYTF